MPEHEHFEELCALAAIDQLSASECRELLEHLPSCPGCERACEQFHFVVGQLPIPEPVAKDSELQSMHSASYRRKFLERARAEGVHFTQEEFAGSKRRFKIPGFAVWRPYVLGAASAIAVIVVSAAVLLPHFLSPLKLQQIAQDSGTAMAAPTQADVPSAENAEDDTIAQLKQLNEETKKQLRLQRQQLLRTEAAYQQLLTERQQWIDRERRLQSDDDDTKRLLATARGQIEKLGNDKDSLAADLVSEQARIKELSDEIQSQIAAVERERQLTAAARDVRELMGARNLHMIDVADLDGHGKPRKSFGRVFYTEGKSLIFYAFDLSQKGSASKVAFQAWGQRPGGSREVRNLGIFHVDDQGQKRWVLRVDNPELVRSVESVFVTVEPSPGSDRPSGRKLLYAYLGTAVNHP